MVKLKKVNYIDVNWVIVRKFMQKIIEFKLWRFFLLVVFLVNINR